MRNIAWLFITLMGLGKSAAVIIVALLRKSSFADSASGRFGENDRTIMRSAWNVPKATRLAALEGALFNGTDIRAR
jgi:hypothetical protein